MVGNVSLTVWSEVLRCHFPATQVVVAWQA